MRPSVEPSFQDRALNRPELYGTMYDDAEKMVLNLDATVWLLKTQYQKQVGNNPSSVNGAAGFLITEVDVEFTADVAHNKIFCDYASGTYRVLAPVISRETSEEREKRRNNLLLFFGPIVIEAQIRGTAQINRLLSEQGREDLIKKYLSRHRLDSARPKGGGGRVRK